MPIRLVVGDRVYEWPWSLGVLETLRRFARFDPATRTWRASHVPCWAARLLAIDGECFDAEWRGGYAVVAEPEERVRAACCYRARRWKVERDEEGESASGQRRRRRVVPVEEEYCLYRRLDDGRLLVPRGIVMRITKRVPDFAPGLPELSGFDGLRDYQAEVARSAWARLRKTGAATIQMATGAGKSYLAGYLARKLVNAGYAVILSALTLDLVYQLREFAARFGATRGVHAVTVQTLYRRLSGRSVVEDAEDEEERGILKHYADETPGVGGEIASIADRRDVAFILDEVQHVPARTVRYVAKRVGGGWALRIGLSATPWRSDGHDLVIYAVMGEVVEPRISSSYLIERGYAVPVEIRVVDAPRCPAVRECWNARGAEGYACVRRALAECDERNKFIIRLAAGAEKPVLVLVRLVSHAERLAHTMRRAGLRAAAATGAVKGEERERLFNALRRGQLDVIVATQLADEGLDLPPLRTLVLAMADKSKTRTLQRIGRLVRPWPGKERGIAYELRDSAPFFREHLEERLRLYATEPAWRVIMDAAKD
jgi:superfamily II DNA or RNA helicase